jgi:ring-1,2-phenylacetyl-CoA epoxidase subunit PaaC
MGPIVNDIDNAGSGLSRLLLPADHALFEYLVRMGDDCLILGQRVAEWCGHAPSLEIDLSLSNLALDLIGQATLLLDLAGQVEGGGRDADDLAFHRSSLQFRNCLMVEQPNGDFARTMVRHWLFSTFHLSRVRALVGCSEPRLAAIAAKAAKEARYHVDLSADWVIRLGGGTGESRRRTVDALEWHWRFIDELFELDDIELSLFEAGVVPDAGALRTGFDQATAATLAAAGLERPTARRAVTGGRRGHHTEHLSPLLAVMQVLPREHPGAKW